MDTGDADGTIRAAGTIRDGVRGPGDDGVRGPGTIHGPGDGVPGPCGGRVGVLVNSCESYAPSTLPPLLRSLAAAGVPPGAVRVVVGDCAESSCEVVEGVERHRRPSAMLDNNGLAWVTLDARGTAWDVDWIVYLHDTCSVDEGFWTACGEVVDRLEREAVDCARLCAGPSMGMGFYRVAWLRRGAPRDRLAAMYTEDAAGRLALKNRLHELEDTLFQVAQGGAGTVVALQHECGDRGVRKDAYGTDTPRRCEHYPVPGIVKLKANWGQGGLMVQL